MQRTGFIYFLALSLLFTSLVAVLESVEANNLTHNEFSLSHNENIQSSDINQADENDDHCIHCCHSHAGTLFRLISTINNGISTKSIFVYQQNALNYAQTPPTPPPNT